MRKLAVLGLLLCLTIVTALSDSRGNLVALPAAAVPAVSAARPPAPTDPPALSKAAHVPTEPKAVPAPVAKRPAASTAQGKRLAEIDRNRAAEVTRVKGMYKPLGWYGTAPTKVGTTRSVHLARSATSLAAANPCDTLPGEPYGVQYTPGPVVQAITNNSNGIAELTVRNSGTNVWGDGSYVGYRLFNSAGTEIPGTYPTTPIPSPFLSGGSIKLNATVKAMAPGTWKVVWDTYVGGVGWLTGRGACAATVEYTVVNQPPNMTLLAPANGGAVTTRVPMLDVDADDPDDYIGSVAVQFAICSDKAMTKDCLNSAWLSATQWRVPSGILEWNETFYWSARVRDGAATVDLIKLGLVHQSKVVVPAPDPWRLVGQGLGLATVKGVVFPSGVWVRSEVDAALPTASPSLEMLRVFSSGGVAQNGVFGKGWSSLLDAGLVESTDKSTLTFTYPDGRQEIFGRDAQGRYIGRAELGVSTRVENGTGGQIIVKQSSQISYVYGANGDLLRVDHKGSGSLTLNRDATGRTTSVTHAPSGRVMTVGWYRIPKPATASACDATGQWRVGNLTLPTPDTGVPGPKWSYTYDQCGRLGSRVDATNAKTLYSINAKGGLHETTPEGRQADRLVSDTGWFYAATGISPPHDHRTLLVLDTGGGQRRIDLWRAHAGEELSYVTNVNELGGPVVVYCQVKGVGEGADESCPPASTNSLYFDDLNRLRSLRHLPVLASPSGPQDERRWEYNATNGRFDSSIDENFNVTTLTYDGWGNMKGRYAFRDPNHQVTTNTTFTPDGHTGADGLISGVCVSGSPCNPWMFTYDAADRLTKRVGPAAPGATGSVENYAYTAGTEAALDRTGTTTSGVMPAGLLRTTTTDAGALTQDYSASADVVRVRELGGRVIRFERDGLGRVAAEVRPSPAGTGEIRSEFRFDAMSRVIEEIRPASTNAVTGQTSTLRICRTFDRDGNLKVAAETSGACAQIDAAGSDARITRFDYDTSGRLMKVTDAAGGVTTKTYDPRNPSQVTEEVDARGNKRQFFYDTRGRLARSTTLDPLAGTPGPAINAAVYTYDPAGRVTAIVDVLGRRTEQAWTGDDLLAKVIRKNVCSQSGDCKDIVVETRSYDDAGRVISQVLGGLQRTDYTYDAEGRLLDTIIDPVTLKRRHHRVYDSAGRLTGETVSDAAGATETVNYTVDAEGQPTKVIADPGGLNLTTSLTRNADGDVIASTDARGAAAGDPAYTTNTVYDTAGRPVVKFSPSVGVEEQGKARDTQRLVSTVGYNAFGDVSEVRSPRGQVTSMVYDRAGRLIERRSPVLITSDGQALAPVERYEYSAASDRTAVIDALGRRTDFEYDVAGRMRVQTDPALTGDYRRTRKFDFDAAGQLTVTEGPVQEQNVGRRTPAQDEYRYDALGRAIEHRRFLMSVGGVGRTTIAQYLDYDGAGRLVRTREQYTNRAVDYGYNGAGEKTSEKLAGRAARTFGYDLQGRLVWAKDERGRAVTKAYDRAGRLASIVRTGIGGAEPRTETYELDAVGNVISSTDPRGSSTRYTFDAASQLTQIVQPVDETKTVTLSAGYDADGSQTRTTDGRGNTTWRSYNVWGALSSVTEPETERYPDESDRTWSYLYDVAGRRVEQRRPGGVVEASTWDAWDRVTRVEATSPNPNAVPNAVKSFTYDDADRLKSIELPQGRQTFSWRTDDVVEESQGPLGYSVRAYSYEMDALPTWETDQTGERKLEHNLDGTLARIGPAQGSNVRLLTDQAYEVSYDGSGIPTYEQWKTPAGAVTKTVATSLSAHGDTAKITLQDGTAASTIDYARDTAGNITKKTVTNPPGTTGLAESGGDYRYDLMNRLTGWTPQNGDPAVSWTWDNANNRTGEAVAGGASKTWSYNERNQLLNQQDSAGGNTSFINSPTGNITKFVPAGQPSRELQFDAFDRLVKDGPASYSYDGLDRLVRRTTSAPAAGDAATQNFGYFTTERDPNVIDTAGGTPRGMAVVRTPDQRLIAAADYAGKIGDPFKAEDFTGLRQPILDAHTDVVGWRSFAGSAAVTDGVAFGPFGQAASGTPQRFGFQSDWSDPATGATWMDARWYEPDVGSFLSRDTADLGLTGAASLNRYSYGNANPTSMTDPTGHWAIALPVVLGVVLAAGLLAAASSLSNGDSMGNAIDAFGTGSLAAGRKAYQGAQAATSWAWNQTQGISWPGTTSGTTTGSAVQPGTSDSTSTITHSTTTNVAPTTPRIVTPPPPPPPYIVAEWTSTRLANFGSTVSASVSSGYRVLTTRLWADKYGTDHTVWSDGGHAQSPEYYLGRIVIDSSAIRIRTIDPDRVIARVAGAIDYAAAGIAEYTNALFAGGTCGLTATISACAGQGTKQVVGGNCAPIAFTQGGCVNTEPRPGPPGGLRESAGIALNEAAGTAGVSGGILGPQAQAGGNQPCKPSAADPDCDESKWVPDENYSPAEIADRGAKWQSHVDSINGRAAQKAVKRGQAPREIGRIDKPEQDVPGSQWHAQGEGKGSPGINMDGSFHDGDPSWSRKTLEWLWRYGWRINW